MAATIRESVAATNRVAERLDRHNRAKNNHEPRHGNGNGDEGESGLRKDNRPMTLASFLKINPPQFHRNTNVTRADDWFKEIRRSMRAQVPEEQRVKFTAYMLRNDAQHWW
ncbi:hypothetical protein AHAS_Ahas02G0105600 [Arachis hypogaea]